MFIVVLILSVIISFNAFFAFVFSHILSLEALAAIMETNVSESVSMLRHYIIPAILILALTTSLLLLSRKELKDSFLSRKASIIIFLLYSLVFTPLSFYRRISLDGNIETLQNDPYWVITEVSIANMPLVYGNISLFILYKQKMAEFKELADSPKIIPNGINLNDTTTTPRKIFFVLGESANREHLSLYGYPTPTTPFLDSIAQALPSQINHYNAIAPATLTRDAVRIILTFATPRDIRPFFSKKSMIELAGIAGYKTYWISNQEIGTLVNVIQAKASETIFDLDKVGSKDDLNLIPIIQKNYRDDEKQLFLIHLNGSHMSYSDKYDDIDKIAIPGNNSITNEYDRSIHHTDRVLKEIYNIARKDSTAIIYYVSDHGEQVGVGHALFLKHVDQYKSPLITISREPAKIDSIVKRYVDPETSTLNASASIYILAEMMGYSVPDSIATNSIEDGKYVFLRDNEYMLFKDIERTQQ